MERNHEDDRSRSLCMAIESMESEASGVNGEDGRVPVVTSDDEGMKGVCVVIEISSAVS